MKKILLAGIAALTLSATAFALTPVGEYNHQVVIEFQDGGPPITKDDGTKTQTLSFQAGPYRAKDCQANLIALMGWFRDAEKQINGAGGDVKVIGGRCEALN